MIDVTKPLELADGTPVEFKAIYGDEIAVWVGNKHTRYFSLSGEHLYGAFPSLRNVQQPELTDPIKAYIDRRIHEELNERQGVVDPDVIAVRGILGAWSDLDPEDIRKDDDTFQAALAAYKKHKNA